MDRTQKLAKVWTATHRDYKGVIDGKKTIMVFRNGTQLVPLDDLTNAEIAGRLPAKVLETEVNRLAALATFNNPVSVMRISQLTKAVKEALRDGLSDDEVVEIGRKFIAQAA